MNNSRDYVRQSVTNCCLILYYHEKKKEGRYKGLNSLLIADNGIFLRRVKTIERRRYGDGIESVREQGDRGALVFEHKSTN